MMVGVPRVRVFKVLLGAVLSTVAALHRGYAHVEDIRVMQVLCSLCCVVSSSRCKFKEFEVDT